MGLSALACMCAIRIADKRDYVRSISRQPSPRLVDHATLKPLRAAESGMESKLRRSIMEISSEWQLPTVMARACYHHTTDLIEPLAARGIVMSRSQVYRLTRNPDRKAERLNRTLATESAYSGPFASNAERAALLPHWLDYYNLNRPHLGIGGHSPINRITSGSCSVHLALPSLP